MEHRKLTKPDGCHNNSYRISGIAVPLPICENKKIAMALHLIMPRKYQLHSKDLCKRFRMGNCTCLVVVLFWGDSSLDPFCFSWGLEYGKVFFSVISETNRHCTMKNCDLYCSLDVIVVHANCMLAILLIQYLLCSVLKDLNA